MSAAQASRKKSQSLDLSEELIPKIKNPNYQELTIPSLKAFFRMAEIWGLSIEEQMALLGISANSTYFKWKKLDNPKLDKDKFDRLSYLLRIYKSLQILFAKPEHADNWLKRPNDHALFAGQAPIERMLQGGLVEIYKVCNHLDSLRGIW